MKINNAGTVLDGRIDVLQVVSETEVRAKFLIREESAEGDNKIKEKWSKPVLFRGVDAGAFGAGEKGKMPGVFIVCKQETYIAGNIKRTEFVLQKIDEAAWRKAYLAWKKEKK